MSNENKIVGYYDDGQPITQTEMEIWQGLNDLAAIPADKWQRIKQTALNYQPGDILPGFGVLTDSLIEIVERIAAGVDTLRELQGVELQREMI